MGGQGGGMGSMLGGMGEGSQGGGQSYEQGIMQGFSNGSKQKGQQAPTAASDHAMGLSMMTPYENMSHAQNGMPQLAQLNQMANPGGPKLQPSMSNGYVQFLLHGMRGA